MKRYGGLWDGLVSFDNLLAAAQKARKGKRFRRSVAQFEFNLESELWRLQEELLAKSYRPGAYRTFHVYEPKKRLISAAPYRDRIVHHALTNVLEPIFERSFVFDTYACRRGKGTHAAVRRCQHYARRFRYVLKADIRKFFPSMDHEILKSLIARKIKDRDALWLVAQIIDHSNPQEPMVQWFPGDGLFTPSERRRGIPIGNQTSQFFANVYLDPLDHLVKDNLGMGAYVRYVDDFLVFSDDKKRLGELRRQIGEYLVRLRLRLHPTKTVVFPTKEGVRFLGYRVFPTHRLLAKENVRRFRRRVRRMQRLYAAGLISPGEIRQRIMSWSGHARQADTYWLRSRLFRTMCFQRATAVKPRFAGRVVQQSTQQRAVRQPQLEPTREP
jgi:retron-type reverse transcriptase